MSDTSKPVRKRKSYMTFDNLMLFVQNTEGEILRECVVGFGNRETWTQINERVSRVFTRLASSWDRVTEAYKYQIHGYRDGVIKAFESSMVWCVYHAERWQPTKDCPATIANYPKSRFAHCYKVSDTEYLPYNLDIFLSLEANKGK